MHQDYVMRMIAQMTQVLTRVLGLRKDEEFEAALVEINHGYSLLSGLPASLVHGLSEEDLVGLLSAQGRLSGDYCFILAELLHEEGATWDDMGRTEEAEPRFVKSIRLYLEAVSEDDEHADTERDLSGLDDSISRVSPYSIPPATRPMLFRYLESTGHYDRMENILVAWRDKTESPEAEEALRAFYDRMLEKSAVELIVGGLTRDEVTMALRDLDEGYG